MDADLEVRGTREGVGMDRELDVRDARAGVLTALEEAAERAREYVGQARAANTLRGYRADWAHFEAWCRDHGLSSLPASPESVALYLATLAETHKASTLQRHLSSISQAHKAAGLETPTAHVAVRAVWAGIRRARGVAQEGKAPAVTDDVRAMVASLPYSLLGSRDRVLLLLGFAGAFRRSELVSLDIGDVQETREGLVATLRRSKTDQEGEGRKVGIPYGSNPATCPVRSLRGWIEASGIEEGPLFRGVDRHGRLLPNRLSDKAVSLVVKRRAQAAGLDPSKYSGHSLRAGLATSAAAAGVSERAIMAQTGHRSLHVVRRYIRDGSLFTENAAARVGL